MWVGFKIQAPAVSMIYIFCSALSRLMFVLFYECELHIWWQIAAAIFYIIKNNISDLGWLNSVHINLPAVNLRATVLQSRRSVKNEWQAAWLLRAITCIDLTTLGGDDTRSNVARLCAKVTFMYVFRCHNQPEHQQFFCVVVFCDVMPCMIMASWDVTPCSRYPDTSEDCSVITFKG